MESEKCNQENLNKTEDCKAILQKEPKMRCFAGRLQSSRGKCRPAQSFCKDSENYNTLL